MKRICKWCKKEIKFKNLQQFGAHIRNCPSNPAKQKINEKIAKKNTKERKFYKFNCKKCNKEYMVELTKTQLNKGKYKKFCSRKCANSRQHSKETIQKITKANTGKKYLTKENYKFTKIKIKQCKVCNAPFVVKTSNSKKTCCCKLCYDIQNKWSKNKGENNPMYGKPPLNKNYVSGYFYSNKNNKTWYYKSSYELKAFKIIENNKNILSYEYEPFNIPYDKNNHSTIPDFLVIYKNNKKKLIEIKPKRLLNIWNNNKKINIMKDYCKNNNILFEVWTEKKLFTQ